MTTFEATDLDAKKRSLRHNEKASSSRNLLGIIDRSHQLTVIIPKLYVFYSNYTVNFKIKILPFEQVLFPS